KSFPHLLGCVSCLHGTELQIRTTVDEFERGKDWTPALGPADLVLSPAACYPVYPLAASRGPVSAGGLRFDVACDCFRREPSKTSIACNRSGCANMSASARPCRLPTFARAG